MPQIVRMAAPRACGRRSGRSSFQLAGVDSIGTWAPPEFATIYRNVLSRAGGSARGSVISSVKSNIFEVTGESVLMLYGSHLTGAPTSTLLVLSETPLGRRSLGGPGEVGGEPGIRRRPASTGGRGNRRGKLGAEDVRTIVEGLDPVA